MIVISVLVLSSNTYSQVAAENTHLINLRSEETSKKCEPNFDTRYNRVEVLKIFGTTLNKTAIDYDNAAYSIKKTLKTPKVVNNNERPIGFFVFDLTDTSNKGTPLGRCMEFKDNHIYHFALIHTPSSYSHLVFLENGNLKIFKAVNCKNGDSLDDVINYLNRILKDIENKDEILERVRNYREYGIYATVDDDSLRCP